MKIESKIITKRNKFMRRVLGIVMFCIVLQGNVFAFDLRSGRIEQTNVMSKKSHCNKHGKCHRGPTGSKGANGFPGDPGPNFGQYACLYTSVAQYLEQGDNVLFENQISLAGISYNSTTGIFTLQPGTYSITYFGAPGGELNLVANGSIVSNSPLGGSAAIVTFSNETNTLALQAQSTVDLSEPGTDQCNAMITIYQIN